jgi:hypothetical protein
MQPFASLFLTILILCTLSTANPLASQTQDPEVQGGSAPTSPSDTTSDIPRQPLTWRIECMGKEIKRKCRLISQCDNLGVMTSLAPECESKCLCTRGSSRYRFSMLGQMAGAHRGIPNKGSVAKVTGSTRDDEGASSSGRQ